LAKPKFNVVDESRSPWMTIFLLAWPVLLEQIFTTLVSYADTAMVGALGASATASVSISNSPIMMLNGIIMSLGVGITALVARSAGAGDYEKVKKLIRHALMFIVILGIPIALVVILLHRQIPIWMGAGPDILETAAEYNLYVGFGRIFAITSMMLNSAFRGYGDTKTPLIVNTTMNVVNVCFNFLLINPVREITFLGLTFTMWGAGLGVKGAAIATTLGMMAAGLMTLGVAFFRKNEFKLDFKSSWKLDIPLTKQIFKISIPAMLERLFMSSSGVLTSKTIATLGTANIAANSLCLTAESMSFMPAFAFSTAATTLVGQSLGAKKPEMAKDFVKKCAIVGSVIMMFTGAFLFFMSRQLIGLFTPDKEVIEIAAKIVRLTAFIQVPQVIAWVLSGALRGAGDTKVIFYITASCQWLIRTLFTIIVVRVFHLDLFATHVVVCVEVFARLVLYYLRYRTGKWQNAIE